MKNKTFTITFIVTLIGLLAGFVLGYFASPSPQTVQSEDLQNQINSLQSQVQDLQNQITQKDSNIQALQQQVSELETLLGPISEGDWNLIENFEGSSNSVNTDYFYVAGTELKINWTYIRPDPEYGSLSIYLYKQGANTYTESFWNLQESGTTFAHSIEPSYYYLYILGSNFDYWTITLEVWIPE